MALGDIDNDGDLDMLTAEPHFLFLNQGGTFVDRTDASGIADVGITLALADIDLDGFLDVAFANSPGRAAGSLYRNQGDGNHWLQVELASSGGNRNGIGARLVATAGDLRQTRQILGGRGYEQDEAIAHFGLAGRETVDRLEIRWPSGRVDTLEDIAANQRIRAVEGRGVYHPVRPVFAFHPGNATYPPFGGFVVCANDATAKTVSLFIDTRVAPQNSVE